MPTTLPLIQSSQSTRSVNVPARGAAQLDIAVELRISTKTVSTHIERILSKLGARSRAQAVAVAYLDGLVEARPS